MVDVRLQPTLAVTMKLARRIATLELKSTKNLNASDVDWLTDAAGTVLGSTGQI